MSNTIPSEYWDSNRNRFNSHAYFNTVEHHHISHYGDEESCDIIIVGCKDGRWYIKDNRDGDAKGAADVFNPFDKESYPTFFDSCEMANRRAAEIVSSITGCDPEELMLEE